MTIGIIGAMEAEITNILEDMTVLTTKNAIGLDFYIGSLKGSSHSIVLVRSGIGKVNAALCTQVLADLFAVDMVINTGVAGAISPDVKIGDIVISSEALQHDFDTSAVGDEPGVISGLDTSVFKADNSLVSVAYDVVSELGLNAYVGRVASGDKFISAPEEKNRISQLFSPLCCEMEGAAIAHACYLNRIPFVIIRAISDNAEEGSDVNYARFFRETAVTAGRIVKNMTAKL